MKTIVIHSIHPGEGKTKVAKELAGYLQLQGQSTLLADLDFVTDPARRALGLPSTPNLEDLLEEITRQSKINPFFNINFSEEQMNQYLLTHNSGLKVLSSENAKYLASDERIAEKLTVVVRSLKKLPYDYLIIDTDSSARDYNQAIIQEADHVLIVTDNFRYSVKDLRHYVMKMHDIGFSTLNFKIVLNKVPNPLQVSIEELEQESGLKVIGIIPVLTKGTKAATMQTEDINLTVAEPDKNPEFLQAVKDVLAAL
ncbi:AAA family ATPase [Desulfotomaculum nigrificans]|uniref:AAA family ATPase n=1 Tax=Desulfotomaculum nigrificans TaxID=1565 RepID=UPI0001FADE0A|nr:AAA family ATPase [Desulfotomaculum nigrificans]